jgi:hypothetical protein
MHARHLLQGRAGGGECRLPGDADVEDAVPQDRNAADAVLTAIRRCGCADVCWE